MYYSYINIREWAGRMVQITADYSVEHMTFKLHEGHPVLLASSQQTQQHQQTQQQQTQQQQTQQEQKNGCVLPYHLYEQQTASAINLGTTVLG